MTAIADAFLPLANEHISEVRLVRDPSAPSGWRLHALIAVPSTLTVPDGAPPADPLRIQWSDAAHVDSGAPIEGLLKAYLLPAVAAARGLTLAP